MSANFSSHPKNIVINLNGMLYSVHILKCMTRRLMDLGIYEWTECEYILQWLDSFENGGAMPSEFYFRCPHGNEVKFLDCLLCIWKTFCDLENDVHIIETDAEADFEAQMWTNYHLQADEVGSWSDNEREQYDEHIDELVRHLDRNDYTDPEDNDDTEEESVEEHLNNP